MSTADDLRARGIPDEWVEFFTRIRDRVARVMTDPPPTNMAPDDKPRMAMATDDVTILLAQAEEGVLAGGRADAAIHSAMTSAARSEERLKETLRVQGTLQQRIDDACAAAMERACAAICERCDRYGPAVWEGDDGILPDHPDFDPEDAQWWHRNTADDRPGEGWCGAQRIRTEFQGCKRRPGVECDCLLCLAAIARLAKEGPHGPGGCRDCGGYHIRVDQRKGWGMGCVDCGNWAELPAVIPSDDQRKRHDDLTKKGG